GGTSVEVSARTFGPPASPPLATAVASVPGEVALNVSWNQPAQTGGQPVLAYRVYRDDRDPLGATADPSDASRLLGGETFAYAADARDFDQPQPGSLHDVANHSTASYSNAANVGGRF